MDFRKKWQILEYHSFNVSIDELLKILLKIFVNEIVLLDEVDFIGQTFKFFKRSLSEF